MHTDHSILSHLISSHSIVRTLSTFAKTLRPRALSLDNGWDTYFPRWGGDGPKYLLPRGGIAQRKLLALDPPFKFERKEKGTTIRLFIRLLTRL